MFKKNNSLFITSVLCLIISFNTAIAQENSGAKISALGFFDYSYLLNGDDKGANALEFRRVYFTYENKISDNLKYKFQVDVARDTEFKYYKSDSLKVNDNKLGVFLKNAKVDWNTGYGTVILGMQGMNMFKVQEKTWGYRFIAKSAMDQYKFSSSADIAIGYANKFDKNVSFSAIVSNGTGYKKSENDKYKKVSTQLVYGNTGLDKKDGYNFGAVASFEPYEYKVGSEESTEMKTVFGVFAGLATSGLRIGTEFDYFNTAGPDLAQMIVSGYANYKLSHALDVFGKVDFFDKNTDVDDDATTAFIGGLVWNATKGLRIAPNIRVLSPQVGDSESIFNVSCEFKI